MSRYPMVANLGNLVVDANILFGALLGDNTNRNLILHGQLDLHAPEWLWDELERNRSYLVKKSRATDAAFDLLMEGLRDYVRSIPLATIEPHMETALERLDGQDEFDAPYIAAALAIEGGVWSHDKMFGAKAGVPVLTTGEILAALNR